MSEEVLGGSTASSALRWPAEWEPHEATWMSWPRGGSLSFPGRSREWMLDEYVNLVREIASFEPVYLNVGSKAEENEVRRLVGTETSSAIRFFRIATDEPWCRDYGPLFVIARDSSRRGVRFGYNGWGGIYGDMPRDTRASGAMLDVARIASTEQEIVFEGGAVDSNGEGTILASANCLLGEKRNPGLSRAAFQSVLGKAAGIDTVIWCEAVLAGDDTGGHVDCTARFVGSDRVVAVLPGKHENAGTGLEEQFQMFESVAGGDGQTLNVERLPLPALKEVSAPGESTDQVPASYANFIYTNGGVLVPTFGVPEDDEALEIIREIFDDRRVIGLPSQRIIWGLGSFHCLTLPLPA